MRDDLTDDGSVPSKGYWSQSPDIISHSLVAEPATFFANNYKLDPNEPPDQSSHQNPVYARAASLTNQALKGWSVTMYRSSPSLFLDVAQWKSNALGTSRGEPYAMLPDTDPSSPSKIVVADDHFLLDGTIAGGHCCLIAVASPTQVPSLPASFPTYDDFIVWVHAKQNVCMRNLDLTANYPEQQFERNDRFTNPSDQSDPLLVEVMTDNLPNDAIFGIRCHDLGIDVQFKGQNIGTASAIVPPKFDGFITTWASLNHPGPWPSTARVLVTTYVPTDPTSAAYQYSIPWNAKPHIDRHSIPLLKPNAQLAKLGDCMTVFNGVNETSGATRHGRL